MEGAAFRPTYRLAFGYLTLGFAANAVLPARLGDVARAVLAAGTFKAPRLAIFGTILIERVSDGLTMLGLAILSSLVVASASELQALTGYAVLLAVGGLVVAVVGWIAISRSALASTRIATAISGIVRRLSAGAGALRHVRSAAAFLGLTAVLTTTAILVAWTVLHAVGVNLSPIQTVLFLSGIALSLAIPAAPGALGTYEFVGVAIITGLGYTPEQGLATILLMRIITTFPPALIGLVSIWALHVRPEAIAESAEAPIGQGPADMTRPDVSLVIPAYNSAPYLSENVLRVRDFYARAGIDGEIVVADDGSTDGTADSVEAVRPDPRSPPATSGQGRRCPCRDGRDDRRDLRLHRCRPALWRRPAAARHHVHPRASLPRGHRRPDAAWFVVREHRAAADGRLRVRQLLVQDAGDRRHLRHPVRLQDLPR